MKRAGGAALLLALVLPVPLQGQEAERAQDARDNAAWVLKRRPDFSVEVFKRSFPHKDEAQREPFILALQQAGIPPVT